MLNKTEQGVLSKSTPITNHIYGPHPKLLRAHSFALRLLCWTLALIMIPAV